MAEINEHTINALILRFNLKDSPEVRSGLADAYRTGYGRGYADAEQIAGVGWQTGYAEGIAVANSNWP